MRHFPARPAFPAALGVLTALLLAGCSHPSQQTQAPPPAGPATPPAPSDQMPAAVSVGLPAPGFTTTTTTGKPLSLQSLRGKVVLVDYWATWCGPCKMAMPTLEALHRRFAPQGLAVVGISVDDPSTVSLVPVVARRLGVTYTLSASPDDNNRAQAAYGVQGIPAQFLIDKKGVLRWNQEGFSYGEKQELSALIQKLLAEPA